MPSWLKLNTYATLIKIELTFWQAHIHQWPGFNPKSSHTKDSRKKKEKKEKKSSTWCPLA